MALVVTVGGVDRTSVVQKGSLGVEHRAAGFVSVCALTLVDENHNIAISDEDAITVVDGATTFFSGRVVNVDYGTFTVASRNIYLKCQDENAQLGEVIVDDEEVFSAQADSAIIDSLFDDYLPAVDSQTHVNTIQDPLTITVGPCTLRSALSQICTRTGGYFYVNFDNKLHYFDAEAEIIGWWLSDAPDQVDSFSYFDTPSKSLRATTRLDGVYVVGDGVEGWRGSHGVGDRCAIVRDNRISTATGVNQRGDAILNEYGSAQVVYNVSTYKAGLEAGMDVRFICALYGVDATFTVRTMFVRWDTEGTAYYELELGDPVNPSLIGERLWLDTIEESLGPVTAPRLPVCSLGWSTDIVFSASDHNTIAWTTGDIVAADGTTYSIAPAANTGNMTADTLTYIYLDLDTSATALQTVEDAPMTAIGSRIILVCVAQPVADVDKKAIFQPFGGSSVGVLLVTANLAADIVTANLVGANTIITGSANIDDAVIINAHITNVEADKIKANKLSMGMGDQVFDVDNGLLLLGLGCPITPTSWTSLRGQAAALGGAFHQEAGAFPGTRGLVVEEAGLNYELAPRMKSAGGVLADGWTYWDNLGSGGAATTEVITHPVSERGWLQRMYYEAAAGDAADIVFLYDRTGAGSFAQGDEVTISIDAKGSVSGCILRILGLEMDAGAAGGTLHQGDPISLNHNLERFEYSFTTADADCSQIQIDIYVTNIDNGDQFDIYFGAVNVEKKAYSTTFCCGALDWCAWSGTADASTSTRVVTEVQLDAHCALLSDNPTVTHILRVRMPYDADATWPAGANENYFLDYRGANNANRSFVGYDETNDYFTCYIAGGFRLHSAVQSFKAGDEKLIIVTLDYTADVYKLYIDGILEDNDTTALAPPTGLAKWNLGSSITPDHQAGAFYTEYAALDSILTAEEVAALYALGKPLVDAGAHDKPGLYILDGRVRIASATSGARLELEAESLAIGNAPPTYNSGTGVFLGLDSGTAKFFIGASAGEKILWDGSDLTVVGDITIQNPGDINTSDLNHDAGWTDDTAADAAQVAADAANAHRILGVGGTWAASDTDTVTWTNATLRLGNGSTVNIQDGNTGNMAAKTYIYYNGTTILQTTTNPANIGATHTLVAVAQNGADKANYQIVGGGTYISGDWINTGSLTATQIKALTITAAKIATGTLTTDKINAGSFGDVLFTGNDLILFGPHGRMDTDGWYSSRHQMAKIKTVGGAETALHQERGPWRGSRALVIEEEADNYVDNPIFQVNVTDGWTLTQSGAGGTKTRDTGKRFIGSASCKLLAGSGWVEVRSDNVSVANGDSVTVQARIYRENTGAFALRIYDSSTPSMRATVSATKTGTWEWLTCSWTNNTGAAKNCQLQLMYTVADSASELWVDACQMEIWNVAYTSSFLYGDMGIGYTWAGTAHNSVSSRAWCTVDLSDHASLISANNTMTFTTWVRMPRDADAYCHATSYIFDAIGADVNNWIRLLYDPADDKWKVWINNADRILSSVQTFDKGDWVHLALTLDFTADEYELWVNGVSDGTSTATLSAPTLTTWAWGDAWALTGGHSMGFAFGEFAVLDRVWTTAEIQRHYGLHRPLIDVGDVEAPGLYILDGKFKIASSTSGKRIEITPDEIAGYDSAGTKQFYLDAETGEGRFGAGAGQLTSDGFKLIGSGASGDLRKIRFLYDDSGTERRMGTVYSDWGGGANPCITWVLSNRIAGSPWPTETQVILAALDQIAGNDVRVTVLSSGYAAVSHDLRVGQGLYVGSVGVNPTDNDIKCDEDMMVGKGLYVGNVAGVPTDNDIKCDGTIETGDGHTWNLGTVNSGTITPDRKVFVCIDGSWYTLAAQYGLV